MRNSQHATIGYAIADAIHVRKGAEKHWDALRAIGATEAELRRFGGTIASAERLTAVESGGPAALEEARQSLKDLVGGYRSASGLIVHGMDGRDAKAEQALKMKGPFPGTDLQLGSYVDGIAARMRPYSAKLAARGFGKEKQAQLGEAATAFKRAFAARGKERGAARAATVAREAVLKELRTQTSYFRRLGREALRRSTARADFDRVKLPVRAVAALAPAEPAAPLAKTAT